MPLGYWLTIHLKKIFMGNEEKKRLIFRQFFSFSIKVASKLS